MVRRKMRSSARPVRWAESVLLEYVRARLGTGNGGCCRKKTLRFSISERFGVYSSESKRDGWMMPGLGGLRPKCSYALTVATRPRWVRFRKPDWIR